MVRKLKSIKSQFFAYLAYSLVYSGLTILFIMLVFQKKSEIRELKQQGTASVELLHNLNRYEKAFLLEQDNDISFKNTGENEQLYNFSFSYNQLVNFLNQIKDQTVLSAKNEIAQYADSAIQALLNYNHSILDLRLAYQQRGNVETGLINEILNKLNTIETELSSLKISEANLLSISESLHRYLLSSDKNELESVLNKLDEIGYAFDQNTAEFADPQSIQLLILNFKESLNHLQELDSRIGLHNAETGYLNTSEETYTSSEIILEKLNAFILINIHRRILFLNSLLTFLLLIITAIYLFLIRQMLNKILDPILQLKLIAFQLSKGNIQNKNKIEEANLEFTEIAESINVVFDTLNNRKLFVDSLLKQTFNVDVDLMGKKDIFGKTLLALKETMRKTRDEQLKHNEENRVRRYINEGLAKFATILRQNNDNMELLGDNFIRELVKYFDALQGSLFLINDDDNKVLDLISVFAYDRKKYQNKKIKLGEGLVGTCALEKKSIFLSEIPTNYVYITSGLGDTPPTHLLLVPILQDDEVLGVIEIASLNIFDEHQQHLAENIASGLGGTILAVRTASKTAKLLAQSQQQAAEMVEQEEEMRQNMEELKATQEDMKRKQEILEEALQKSEQASIELEEREIEFVQQQKIMQSIVDNFPKSIFLKDKELNYLVCNKTFATLANSTPEEIAGKTDFDLPWTELAESYRTDDMAVINSGKSKLNYIESQITNDGSKIWIETSKIPLKDEFGEVFAVLGMFEDVTEKIKSQEHLKQNMEDLKNAQEAMRRKQTELETALRHSEHQASELVRREKQISQNNKTMQNVFENIPKAVSLKDKSLKYITGNQIFAQLTGYSIDDLKGKDDFEMPWKKNAENYKQEDLKVIATGESKLNSIEESISPDGEMTWMETSKVPIKDDNNNVVSVLGIFEDITERLKKEDEYLVLKSLIDKSVYLVEYSKNGSILFASNKLASFFNLDPNSFIGKLHSEIFEGSTLDTAVFNTLIANEFITVEDEVLLKGRKIKIVYNLTLINLKTKGTSIYNLIKINNS